MTRAKAAGIALAAGAIAYAAIALMSWWGSTSATADTEAVPSPSIVYSDPGIQRTIRGGYKLATITVSPDGRLFLSYEKADVEPVTIPIEDYLQKVVDAAPILPPQVK